MRQQLHLENASVEATLVIWRRNAFNVLMVAASVVYLPAVVILVVGKGPLVAAPAKAIVLAGYAIILLDTLLWRADYRARMWVNLATGYLLAIVGGIAVPQGPVMRSLPVIIPLTAMVIFGKRVGRAATGISILVLLLAPPIGTLPALDGILTTEQVRASTLPYVVWFQGIAMTAILLEAIVLLDRFHDMLVRSLTERTAAYEELRVEMRERQRLEAEVGRVADEERRRLGHEIHDGVCQQLAAALLRSEALTRWLDPAQSSGLEELSDLSALLEDAIDEARAVAHGLCPLDSDPEALAAALQVLARRVQEASGIACTLEMAGDVSIRDSVVANHLYRIAQEGIANAVKHAHARGIHLVLRGDEDGLLLVVEDDGDGLPEKETHTGMGLRTMVYRAHSIKGDLTVTPGATCGTRVSCRVPRAPGIPNGGMSYDS